MRHFVVLLLLLLSRHSFAQRFPDPIPGLQAAVRFCANLDEDEAIIDCVQLESAADWVTKEALPICISQSFDNEKVGCLRSIVNNEIRVEEVQVCESISFAEEQAQCLAEIRRPFSYRTRIKVDARPGLQAASRLCQSFFGDDDKKRCVREMSQAELYTVEAIQFCESLFSDDEKIACVAKLKNRFIVREEVSACERVFGDNRKLECLEGVRRKYRLR
ncbi:hypothetical protein [Bdellovibrio bacteriovorus]|uniref:hypothetical protein n=1 Tax=Bdellovibrio bacteriovorus TaxID=959 RepID=UPI0035A63A54